MHWICVSVSFYLLLTDFKQVSGDGQFSIKFIFYVNARGRGANGHCCDGRSIFCSSKCDHKFTICIDTFNGDDDYNHCAIGKVTSSKISNKNTIDFQSSIANLPNPVVMPFTNWQAPGVKVKVKVLDGDTWGSDDFVDDLRKQFMVTPGRSPGQGQTVSGEISHRTTLVLELNAHCNEDWYGPDCRRHCTPTDNGSGHYTCDQNTGAKICRTGWTGDSCQQSINDCASNPCQHGARCVDGHNRFTCQCAPGFTGTLCQTNIDDCIMNTCAHGSCIDLVDGFRCQCHPGFTGTFCETDTDDCIQNTCVHGSCIDLVDGFKCDCDPGFTGTLCETDIDECFGNTCVRGSCIDLVGGFKCDCDPGFTGAFCEIEIDNCDLVYCENNGTCVTNITSYACVCPPKFTGNHCEDIIDFCQNSTCSEGETCLHMEEGFMCISPTTISDPNVIGTSTPGVVTEVFVVNTTDHFESDNSTESCKVSNPCLNNGTCWDDKASGSIECICEAGWTGLHCDTELFICNIFSECQNNATCMAYPDNKDYFCICPANWIGKFCEVYIEDALNKACATVSCKNNGTCVGILKPDDHPWHSSTSKTSSSPHYTENAIDIDGLTTGFDGMVQDMITPQPSNAGVDQLERFPSTSKTTKGIQGFNFDRKHSETIDIEYHFKVENETTSETSVMTTDSLSLVYKEANAEVIIQTFCACPEQFTGEYCEVKTVSNISDVIDKDVTDDSKDDDDDKFVEVRKDFEEYPSALLFQHKLSDKDVEQILGMVTELLSHRFSTKSDDIDVQHEVISCLSDNKEEVHAFLFDAFVKDSVISWEIIDETFNGVSEEVNQLLPVPLYTGDSCTPLDGTLDYQKIEHKTWLAKNWYVIVIFCIILVAVICGVGYFIFRRRRNSKQTIIGEYPSLVEDRNSIEILQHQPKHNATGDYFFENKVYEEISDQK